MKPRQYYVGTWCARHGGGRHWTGHNLVEKYGIGPSFRSRMYSAASLLGVSREAAVDLFASLSAVSYFPSSPASTCNPSDSHLLCEPATLYSHNGVAIVSPPPFGPKASAPFSHLDTTPRRATNPSPLRPSPRLAEELHFPPSALEEHDVHQPQLDTARTEGCADTMPRRRMPTWTSARAERSCPRMSSRFIMT